MFETDWQFYRTNHWLVAKNILEIWWSAPHKPMDAIIKNTVAPTMGSRDRRLVKSVVFDTIRHWQVAVDNAETLGIKLSVEWAMANIMAHYTPERHALIINIIPKVDVVPLTISPAGAVNLPPFLYQKYQKKWNDEQIMGLVNAKMGVDVRLNTPKIAEQFCKKFKAENVGGLPSAFRLGGNAPLSHDKWFQLGLFDIQSLASQIAMARVATHVPHHSSILDYCAGAGGKSLCLSQYYKDITLYDKDSKRLENAKLRAKTQGKNFNFQLKEQYDAVLLDAPCSGSGNFHKNPWQIFSITQEKIHQYQEIQWQLLQKSLGFAPKFIIYCTCSLFEEENDIVVQNFMKQNSQYKLIHNELLTPLTHNCDGFYIAILKKF